MVESDIFQLERESFSDKARQERGGESAGLRGEIGYVLQKQDFKIRCGSVRCCRIKSVNCTQRQGEFIICRIGEHVIENPTKCVSNYSLLAEGL